ncbi:hypothetical protein [Thauera sp. Sel9]|uniref:hypothetical protein n=1 Tax=Thauera sp. Sel9 TaxID=2974299 RepID=UPI0021E16FCB|nr:hypothetical protein [Thauera sp. Sel9]MCV2217345.1 hypothetical protein [Thauera sp. Sel9]
MAAPAAPVLVVIGIHREELAFGREVAAALAPDEADVLEIPDGLSGRRPRPDQCFRYDLAHEALYLQLLPHMRGRHRLLIDLHVGADRDGPCADLMCGDAALAERLQAALAQGAAAGAPANGVRVIRLGAPDAIPTRTVIPERIWRNPAFLYLCMEIYLADDGSARPQAVALARRLIGLAAQCAGDAVAVPHRCC